MKGFLLSCLAVFLGALLTVTLVTIGEAAGHAAFPPPPGVKIDPHDMAAMKELMEKIPLGAKVVVVVNWGIATLVGSWFATWFAAKYSRRSVGHGIAVGLIILMATLTTLAMIPHPAWMWVAGLAVVLAGTYIGAILLGGRSLRGKPIAVGDTT